MAQADVCDLSSLKTRRKELVKLPTWVTGSFRQTVKYNKGYPDAGHPHQFISHRVAGHYKSTYVRKAHIGAIKRAVERRRQVDSIINEIAEINIEIIKHGGKL